MNDWMGGEDYDDNYLPGHNTGINWKVLDDALFTVINRGTLKGLTVGARVRRAGHNAVQGAGTITQIHRTHSMAYNYSQKSLEPFKVVWDKTNGSPGGSFDYSPEQLELLPESAHLPLVIDQPKEEPKNEDNLHLC